MSKRDDDGPKTDSNAWMATFADLVTLLITFFVLLLSMSNLDAQAVEDSLGDAKVDMQIEEVVRGGAPQQIEGKIQARNRGMQMGGHRPSPSHAPAGTEQGGPKSAPPASPEKVEAALENIVSRLEGAAYEDIVDSRAGDGQRHRFEALIALLNSPDYQGLFRLVMARDKLRIHFAGDLLFHPGRVRIKPSSLLLLRELGRLLQKNGMKVRVIGLVQPEDAPTPVRKDLYPTQWDLAIARGCNVVRYMIETGSVASQQLGCVAQFFEATQHAPNDAVIFELR